MTILLRIVLNLLTLFVFVVGFRSVYKLLIWTAFNYLQTLLPLLHW